MPTLNDDDRANLAAFLDGELDEAATQALAAKLSCDPAARAEVDALRQAWAMLDYLPRPEPSANFTHRTMERLAMGTHVLGPHAMGNAMGTHALATDRMPVRSASPWLTALAWTLAALAALAVGSGAGHFLWRNELDQAVLSQPRLFENFRVYEPIEDLDFLRGLDQPHLFGDELADASSDDTGPQRGRPGRAADGAPRRLDVQAFLALPAERREQLAELDRQLYREPAALRDRLLEVAQRYRDWLERLDDKVRQQIKDAPDKAARLAMLPGLREQEWLRFQPRAVRDKLNELGGAERAEFLKKVRQDERQWQQDWVIASRFWSELSNKNFQPPARIADLPRDTVDYVNEVLWHMLGKEEKERLSRAEGNWPLFPRTLVELADRHPPALPGSEGPRTMKELPGEVQRRLFKAKVGPPKALRLHEGRWPGFAIALSDQAFRKGVTLPYELWPTHEKCLSPPMQQFFDDTLQPLLTPGETRQLAHAKGKWPEFPQAVEELAHNHKLAPPWFTLPGPRDRWDNYRIHLGSR